MKDISFEWNRSKSIQNVLKHRVSFEEAQTVFLDENAIEFSDPDHPDEEGRFILLGASVRLRILVVCHCFRRGNTIRIISARKANVKEKKQYEGRIK